MADFPPPFDPPSLNVPEPPPEVGEGSPWAPIDGENRDRILDWWRMWWRRVFFPWLKSFLDFLNQWLADVEVYIEEHAVSGYSWRTTLTDIAPTGTTDVVVVVADPEHRPLIVGDLISDQSEAEVYGIVTVVIDATHATVTPLGMLSGTNGLDGHGWWITSSGIAHAGTSDVVLTAESDRTVQVNDLVMTTFDASYGIVTVVTDPTHVTVAYLGTLTTGGGGGAIESIVSGTNIDVDATDPANPVINGLGLIEGTNVTIDFDTNPGSAIFSASAPAGGVVDSIVPAEGIEVDDTDPANPIVGVDLPTLWGDVRGSRNVQLDTTSNPDHLGIHVADDGTIFTLGSFGTPTPPPPATSDASAIANYNGGSFPNAIFYVGNAIPGGWVSIGYLQSIVPRWGMDAVTVSDRQEARAQWIRAVVPDDDAPFSSGDSRQIGDFSIGTTGPGTGRLQWWNGTAWEIITSA